ncbi:fasciclin-like arabinogalactan protein 11 [Phtheirospermum japonicum]|uniref:Fasciclin-like arabinogalactan protein 11 n=1 Tax=Phtheirospermum japonicum TaxID=374723 RepID=A0A830BGX3_9LAMI|nr:fasciclin-like arabinogalactan protein 11 [Phtheirospermum japonicum]
MMRILFLLLLIHSTTTITSGQSPAAAPGPAGPTNVTAILEKAGQFTTFIRLLQNTKVADQINTQLNNSNQGSGLTIFAPTDNAFSGLRPGMLNSFSDQQKVELIQFHVLPNALSASQFQTASNPLRTQAGGSEGSFSLNVTTSGDNQVNITTGVTNATVANTVYTDSQLAVYQVDRVLLPLSFFATPSPAPAPAKPKKAARSADAQSDDGAPADSSSGAICLSKMAVKAMACVVFVQAIFV